MSLPQDHVKIFFTSPRLRGTRGPQTTEGRVSGTISYTTTPGSEIECEVWPHP